MSAWDCSHEGAALRLRRISGGGIQYVAQCQTCGSAVGGPVKHAEVQTLPPDWDEDLADRWAESVRTKLVRARDGDAEERRSRYTQYLQTTQWQLKRAAVLRRDRYICQGCMENRASEVHHLTYAHIGNELLFELVSLCHACHETVHDLVEPAERAA